MNYSVERSFAESLDVSDPLRSYRDRFFIPKHDGGECFYFCGNSLGLQPKTVKAHIDQELKDWAELGVEGHFHAKRPWMPYHEFLTEKTARLVGGLSGEVVNMNSLTANLHLLMVSFYRPTKERFKILVEKNAFPSDQYAIASQVRYHGYNPKEGVLELAPRPGEEILRSEDIETFIDREGDRIALILMGGVNYYTGQAYDRKRIVEAGHRKGCIVGFDLAHAAGNLVLNLHDENVDFGAWCSYKYLNAGPGGIAGVFIHERHTKNAELPRFAGWWGHDKKTRFLMGPEFSPIPTAEAWQLSNPPIFQLAALNASLEIFDEVGMEALRDKCERLTGYLEFLIDSIPDKPFRVITPRNPVERGCQLSIQARSNGRALFQKLMQERIVADWREPDVIRVAPVPLYNRFSDVYRLYEALKAG